MFTTFEISAAGMNLERMRLDVAAANLANAHTSAHAGRRGVPAAAGDGAARPGWRRSMQRCRR
ncbi:MAG: flagellar basal body protein [Chromatiales bacterium]|nr:flagellar basal body protein [Chromatiales bacterium]